MAWSVSKRSSLRAEGMSVRHSWRIGGKNGEILAARRRRWEERRGISVVEEQIYSHFFGKSREENKIEDNCAGRSGSYQISHPRQPLCIISAESLVLRTVPSLSIS